jgi:hypothetical protein
MTKLQSQPCGSCGLGERGRGRPRHKCGTGVLVRQIAEIRLGNLAKLKQASRSTPLQARASRVCASPGGEVLAPPAESSKATDIRVPAPDNRASQATPLQRLEDLQPQFLRGVHKDTRQIEEGSRTSFDRIIYLTYSFE